MSQYPFSRYQQFVYDCLDRLREQLQWTSNAPPSGIPPPSAPTNNWHLTGGTYYVYDGKRVIQERYTNNTPTVSYTRGNDLSGSLEGAGGIGGLLARSDSYVSGSFTNHIYYHADGNGNITYLVNTNQTLAASYRYDPFGNLMTSSGAFALTNTYRFSSKEYIPNASLYYYLYRFYDTGAQQWMNRDPIEEKGGLNLYAFVANAPINLYDLFGLDYPCTTSGWEQCERTCQKRNPGSWAKGCRMTTFSITIQYCILLPPMRINTFWITTCECTKSKNDRVTCTYQFRTPKGNCVYNCAGNALVKSPLSDGSCPEIITIYKQIPK